MPIALVGATAGILVTEVGWWAAVLAVLPVAYVPELVISRARVPTTAMRDLAALLSTLAILATVALVTPVADTATVAILCVLSVFLGIELAPRRGALVPPLVALVVAPACALLDDDRVRVGAVAVAVVATATSWWCERRPRRATVLGALAVAFGAALVAAQLAIELPRTLGGVVLGAVVGGVVFEVLTLVVAPQRRRQGLARVWMAPLLAVSVAGAEVCQAAGDAAALLLVGLVAAALVGWAGWGAPAWGSRVAVRAASSLGPHWLRVALVLAAGLAVLAAIVGVSVGEHAAAVAWSWTAAGIGEVVVAMAAAGVRQWRFAPWPRRRGFAATIAGAVVLVGVGGPLGTRGSTWGPIVVGATMVVVVLTASVPGRQLRRSAQATEGGVRSR
jgi:hypothetical protein